MRFDRAQSIEARASLQAARMLQARLPRALAITIASFLVVALLEVAAHPERTGAMALYLPAAIAALVAGAWLARWRATRAVWFIATALSLFVAVVTSYFIRVGGQSETLAFGLVYLAFGASIVLRWGAGPQTVVAAAAAVGYVVAVAVGLPSTTPLPIQVVGILSFAGLTIGTAGSLARQQLDLLRRDEVKETLLAVARDLAESAELGDALGRVQQRAATVLASDIVATYLLDAAGRSFRLAGAHGIPPDLREAAQSVHVAREETVFSADLSRQQTLIINDVARWPVLRPELMRQFGIRALLIASLAARDRSLGLFVAVRTSARPFVEADAQLFDSIARQLGIAIETEEHDRREREEAGVATALARVGRELISALDTGAVLHRLCRVSSEVLGCDSSHAFLRDRESGAFVVRAGAGDSAERWESLSGLRVTEAQAEQGFGLFRDADVVHLGVPPPDPRWPPLPAEFGIAAALAVALRRGTELVGLFSVGRRRPKPFGPREERIGLGIAHLASLALENARLMEELDGAHRVKSDFVANMSHELRTPLNVIMGYNDLLGEGGFGALSAEQLDVVERIGRRSRELLELINVTLDLSRIEAGSVPLAVCELDVAMLLHDLEAETQMTRRKPRVELQWQVVSGLPSILTDPTKLRVVVRNVVMNAIKFTDEGTIRVGAVALDDGVEIAVSDTGIGIPADMVEAIFEPFRQIEDTPGRGGGAGLGLHLSRRLVAMLGGRITVETELGRGSTFRIWMPRSKSAGEGASTTLLSGTRVSLP